MDQYLIYFVPFLVVGFGVMLAPFITYGWPDWLTRFVEFCAEMANGVWVAGVALVIMMGIGLPIHVAAVMSWPVMYFGGRYFARLSDEWQTRSYEIKRRAREEREQREKEERSNRS
ncbi:hypothetical protein [Loktanella sp. SALINAS62]|uniref:hypothetical protein n=1 Tax=Loktanella sp. SALINAS62 TaxID=2706124 RepID=UPI001B8CF145|nr:hypothetical protein [Loktanella sp. SALINAS62]MBS1303428.1 hypothetical protein [Loktanella sp. SALINAS62]